MENPSACARNAKLPQAMEISVLASKFSGEGNQRFSLGEGDLLSEPEPPFIVSAVFRPRI
jgi:hypothetical protein